MARIEDAGRRDKAIAFERAAIARGALGTKSAAGWAALGSRLAKVLYGSGSERRQAAVEGAVQTATFRVLADSLTNTVTERDRISFAGQAWDVTGIAPIGSDEIEFTATAARG